MKRNLILVTSMLIGFLTSCTQKTELESLVELNGADSAEVFNKLMGYEEKWMFVGYGDPKSNLNDIITYKQALYIDGELAAIEFESELQAVEANKILYSNNNTVGLFQKGRCLFIPWTGGYVLAYGLDSIKGDGISTNAYIYDEELQKNILLVHAKNKKPINDTYIIDGYDVIAGNAMYFCQKRKLQKLIIGSQVKEIMLGALLELDFEVLEFQGDVELIGACNIEKNDLFSYTIIPNSCEMIDMYAFDRGNIYCEAKSKPDGWHTNFAYKNAKVYWADEWEYDENNNPVLLVEK